MQTSQLASGGSTIANSQAQWKAYYRDIWAADLIFILDTGSELRGAGTAHQEQESRREKRALDWFPIALWSFQM
jgi:hypothetical protein